MPPRPSTPPLTQPGDFIDPDFDWRRAKHIARVSGQIEKRRKNPPKKNGRKVFSCQLCKRSCSSRFQLGEHLRGDKHKRALARQKIEEEPLKCELCNKNFDRESNYKSHLVGRRHIAAKRRRDLKI